MTIARSLGLGIAAGVFALASVARAQDARGAEVAPPGGQIDATRQSVSAGQIDAGASADVRTGQLTPRQTARDPQGQLNAERRSAQSGDQLYRGGRTAQPTDALSRPNDGRRQAVVRVGGKDRCDPGNGDGSVPKICDRVIETRAAEFTTPAPNPLSPEQRLLVDKRLRDAPATAESAVAQIGRNAIDPQASAAQTVASLVLTAPTTEAPRAGTTGDLTTAGAGVTDAIIQAIVTGSVTPR